MRNGDPTLSPNPPAGAEWLEADGLGGFAMGTTDGIRTRRYHALLVHAATPPTGRMTLVNGFEAWLEVEGARIPLTSQRYEPGIVHADGAGRIERFEHQPWPRWVQRLDRVGWIEHEVFVRRGLPLVALHWRLRRLPGGPRRARLVVRPLLSGRDSHALQHANPVFGFEPERIGDLLVWHPYPGVPGLLSLANAEYAHAPDWYRHFLYDEELRRGLDCIEDLASPGLLTWDLDRGEAAWLLAADTRETRTLLEGARAPALFQKLRAAEGRRRERFPSRLHRSADAYVVARGTRRTIVAGYPWFTDWGRDTFIALRGLCLAAGRLDDARRILLEWAGAVSEGMLPNRFVEQGGVPEFNSVDASLWYVIAVHDWLEAMATAKKHVGARDHRRLGDAVEAILEGYTRGTRHGIRADTDGLLAAGEPGVQLTWMDAKVGDWVVTPRIGKPVEVEALWINALWIGCRFAPRWREAYGWALEAFQERFWNEERGCLYDVVDVNHEAGAVDRSLRPNQILAVGGLPLAVIDGERARRVVDAVESRLWTPLGPRSLGPGEPGYIARYGGGVRERDGAYHQGTVWPWLAGPFVEAWVRVRGGGDVARAEARARFVEPLLRHLDEGGLSHVSEIADGDPPHAPNGCPFQAWSVGELLRLVTQVVPTEAGEAGRTPRAPVASGADPEYAYSGSGITDEG